jgi:HK97 family phage portal protein
VKSAKRSIFNKLLGAFTGNTGRAFTQFKLMNSFIPIFSTFGNNAYKSSVTRSAINAIAQNAAKLKPKVIGRDDEGNIKILKKYTYILSKRPNQFMSAYDFYLKLVTQLLNKNNAFALVEYINGKLNLIPVNYSTVEAVEFKDILFLRFYLIGGEQLTVPYQDCIHLRRHFYDDDLYGESNDAILPTLEVINTMDDGLTNAVKSSASLRGILKFQNAMLKDSNIESQRKAFVDSFLTAENNGGIGALDAKSEFQELKGEPKFVNPIQAKAIKERVYDYYHISEAIIQSKYTEDEWNAFYESTIEPMAIQMSLEFTEKILTDREKELGHEIMFEANRLQYASNKTKISLVNTLMPLGLLTINESREVFNMTPIEGDAGEKRLISLNYVDAEKQNKYQVDDDPDDVNGGGDDLGGENGE